MDYQLHIFPNEIGDYQIFIPYPIVEQNEMEFYGVDQVKEITTDHGTMLAINSSQNITISYGISESNFFFFDSSNHIKLSMNGYENETIWFQLIGINNASIILKYYEEKSNPFVAGYEEIIEFSNEISSGWTSFEVKKESILWDGIGGPICLLGGSVFLILSVIAFTILQGTHNHKMDKGSKSKRESKK